MHVKLENKADTGTVTKQNGGWVYSRFDHVIHGGLKYTNFLASGRGMSVD